VANHVKQLYFWVTPHTDPHPFHDFFAQLANATAVPVIFSISYGESEVGNTYSWLQQLNNEFMLVGMRGISVLFASGDR
jgi:subtilase family serine protease